MLIYLRNLLEMCVMQKHPGGFTQRATAGVSSTCLASQTCYETPEISFFFLFLFLKQSCISEKKNSHYFQKHLDFRRENFVYSLFSSSGKIGCHYLTSFTKISVFPTLYSVSSKGLWPFVPSLPCWPEVKHWIICPAQVETFIPTELPAIPPWPW